MLGVEIKLGCKLKCGDRDRLHGKSESKQIVEGSEKETTTQILGRSILGRVNSQCEEPMTSRVRQFAQKTSMRPGCLGLSENQEQENVKYKRYTGQVHCCVYSKGD